MSTCGLTRNFDGLRAVDGVNFDLDRGEVRALIGPNEAGKTTLVGMICGRIAPSAGRIVMHGADITGLPAHRRIRLGMAYTLQITSIFPRLSVHENVALAARRHRRGPDVAAVVGAALGQVGLTGRSDQDAADLFYGHQRLLEIAMGLAQAPRLLIPDEPTQGLADAEIAGFKTLIRDLAQRATILLIEHNMTVVMELATRVTVMDHGRILAEGTPAEIHADAAVQAAYLATG